ncbi:MAG: CocE/NonD family hydrolase, partial [Cyclobacteriaceae bacterium]
YDIQEKYEKHIYDIPMRDGIKLHTIIYTPKDKSEKYPFLLMRTCYSIRPYEPDVFRTSLGPNRFLQEEGYIFVYQDVRGRFMSEGKITNMTPNIPGNKHKNMTDESSDTWDTIEWLLKNIKNHNGKAGIYGTSYPGFYAAASLPDAHPALKAASPQAPIADFYFDDFHHNGAFIQAYLPIFPVFGYQKETQTTEKWYTDKYIQGDYNDGYQFHLELGPLKNVTEDVFPDNFFWQEHVEHPNYDDFWQKRNLLPHLENVKPAVLVVGGWFDAEDLYGPLNIYKTIEKSGENYSSLIMGPWSHGDWHRNEGSQVINHIHFGDSISKFFQQKIETPFFNHYLKGKGALDIPEAWLFDTGANQWRAFEQWPSPEMQSFTFYFHEKEKLSLTTPGDANEKFEYISDPMKPIPYTSEIEPLVFTPRRYMTDDQRYASRRPDVLTFATEPLQEDLTLGGEIMAYLNVATTATDMDLVVKIIDEFPAKVENKENVPEHVTMEGYQMLVRSELFRARFRNSFEKPEPFVPNQKTQVKIPVQDILHTFKKGHRIMIQIHSTWFPLMDRNPQNYVENIFKAEEKEFTKATITLFGDSRILINAKNTKE